MITWLQNTTNTTKGENIYTYFGMGQEWGRREKVVGGSDTLTGGLRDEEELPGKSDAGGASCTADCSRKAEATAYRTALNQEGFSSLESGKGPLSIALPLSREAGTSAPLSTQVCA